MKIKGISSLSGFATLSTPTGPKGRKKGEDSSSDSKKKAIPFPSPKNKAKKSEKP